MLIKIKLDGTEPIKKFASIHYGFKSSEKQKKRNSFEIAIKNYIKKEKISKYQPTVAYSAGFLYHNPNIYIHDLENEYLVEGFLKERLYFQIRFDSKSFRNPKFYTFKYLFEIVDQFKFKNNANQFNIRFCLKSQNKINITYNFDDRELNYITIDLLSKAKLNEASEQIQRYYTNIS